MIYSHGPGKNKNTICGERECEYLEHDGEILKIFGGGGDMEICLYIPEEIMKNLLGYAISHPTHIKYYGYSRHSRSSYSWILEILKTNKKLTKLKINLQNSLSLSGTGSLINKKPVDIFN